MAPTSAEWQRLAKIKPAEIDFNDDTREDQNEKLGLDFTRVRRTKTSSSTFSFRIGFFSQLNANDFDGLDDLKLALRLGQQFVKVKQND